MNSITQNFNFWLNKLTWDIDHNRSLVEKKLLDFPGDQLLIQQALTSLNSIIKTDKVGKTLVEFLEWYSTGNISDIKVELNEDKSE